jgi:hypothetical protein
LVHWWVHSFVILLCFISCALLFRIAPSPSMLMIFIMVECTTLLSRQIRKSCSPLVLMDLWHASLGSEYSTG